MGSGVRCYPMPLPRSSGIARSQYFRPDGGECRLYDYTDWEEYCEQTVRSPRLVMPRVQHLGLILRGIDSASFYRHLIFANLNSLHLSGTTHFHP
ncbi:hypothetical protein BDV98DRAFT_574542 [Pterulicium gracile]|uniref:Uncharacterized protein n=1 Tax=Pterulicium gracile TaxID=1884261 RepID=A0A5C3Q6Q9_9AGAR|nr:hypothetical protein BDV98DRAFT_574542 [Pterula gracilis]